MPTTATLAKVLTAALALQGGVGQPSQKQSVYNEFELNFKKGYFNVSADGQDSTQICKFNFSGPYEIARLNSSYNSYVSFDGVSIKIGGKPQLNLPSRFITFKKYDDELWPVGVFYYDDTQYTLQAMKNEKDTEPSKNTKLIKDNFADNYQYNVVNIDWAQRTVRMANPDSNIDHRVCDFNENIPNFRILSDKNKQYDKTFLQLNPNDEQSSYPGVLSFYNGPFDGEDVALFTPALCPHVIRPIKNSDLFSAQKAEKQIKSRQQLVSKFQNQRNNKR